MRVKRQVVLSMNRVAGRIDQMEKTTVDLIVPKRFQEQQPGQATTIGVKERKPMVCRIS